MAPLLVVLARLSNLARLTMGGEDDFHSNMLSESQAQRIHYTALAANSTCMFKGFDFENYDLDTKVEAEQEAMNDGQEDCQ